jgi:hypothetical protein
MGPHTASSCWHGASLGPMKEVRTSSIVRRQTRLGQDSRTGHTGPYLVLWAGEIVPVVVVGAVEYAEVWLVVESAAER